MYVRVYQQKSICTRKEYVLQEKTVQKKGKKNLRGRERKGERVKEWGEGGQESEEHDKVRGREGSIESLNPK